ncbi:uncharacterized protein ASPGLDRAFT_64664 [Aspergillus glaucus CBS 516.65]|uniref:Protein kinase domain-containing protein n=1 Tax=Aspergillus glaucus CBS 516.65 TaxID=1160497 RepID=A0A1L9VR33_ASPGL|nr:hypothetical protein ASPGLDRAFT_64664 [Aspergillus glaucus CBS 516.65]OJJ86366.1 hypothetical protein ASPGLDRAFT_64664 [Aspergillus glaucus CBS 516.65]
MDKPSTSLPKPLNPYRRGCRLTVRTHTHPPSPQRDPECQERREVSPVERCLKYPPLPGGPLGPGIVALKIEALIRAGDGRNSQVMAVQVLDASPDLDGRFPASRTVVAKIYDPLYVDDEENCVNPFRSMDRCYTHEARAYELLSFDHRFRGDDLPVPRYCGSYSLDITEATGSRTVRLILLEHIGGMNMLDANQDVFAFPQHTRQQMMKSIVDFESYLFERDIWLRDVCPRNIIIAQDPDVDSFSNPGPFRGLNPKRLVFVDLAHALFKRMWDSANPEEDVESIIGNRCHGQYISPLLRWDEGQALKFQDWFEDWDWDEWIAAEYAHTAASITPEIRRAFPGPDEPLF